MIFRIIAKLKRKHAAIKHKYYTGCLAGYKAHAEKRVIDRLHPKIVNFARTYNAQKRDDIVNELFFISFFVKAQKEPDEAAYNAWIQDFATLAFNGGSRHRLPMKPAWKNEIPRLGFIGLGDDPSAYEHIYFICKYLQETGTYKPYLFLFSYHGVLDQIKARFNAIGTEVIFVNFNESNVPKFCLDMRNAFTKEQIDIAAWVHLPTIMFFLYGMQVAPIQIFISQYLHPDIARFKIDGLVTYGSIAEKSSVFLHDSWRVLPSSLKITRTISEDSGLLRQRFANDETVILATLGRIEKIRQEKFLKCVASILEETKNTVYLYTGYEDDPQIAQYFASYSLSERVKFIGWVDVDAYMQIIDIVLDSFPIATGITTLKAIVYGKAVLSMGEKYSYMGRDVKPIIERSGFSGFHQAKPMYDEIKEIAAGLSFLPYAVDEDDYIGRATELVLNPEKREKLASFQFLCAKHLYLDTDLMGSIFVEHLKEIEKSKA